MGPHPGSLIREPQAPLGCANCAKAAEIIHLAQDQAAKSEEPCFKAHLGKCDIMVDAFDCGLFSINI
jgi:hypothetical protein